MNTLASGLSFLSTKMTEGVSYLSKSTTHFTARKAVVVGMIAAATITALSMSSHTMDLPVIDKAGIALLATTACSSLCFTDARRIKQHFENRHFQKFLSTCLEKSNDKGICIENLATMSEEERKQLALLCYKIDPQGTAKYFKNLGIAREEDRKEIALLFATIDPFYVAEYFKNFEITREEDVKEIALLCGKIDPCGTVYFFENFGITREEDKKEIAFLWFVRSPELMNNSLDNFMIKDQVFKRRLRLIGLIIDCSELSPERRNTIPLQVDQDLTTLGFPADSKILNYLQQERGQLSSLDLNSPSAIRCYQHLCMAELLRSSVGKEGIRPFIELALISIFELRDKTLIPSLFLTLCKANGCQFPSVSEQEADAIYKSFVELSTEGIVLRKHFVVIALAFIEGISKLKEDARTSLIKGMKDTLPQLRSTLKDARKKLDVQYVRTLLALRQTPLSPEQIFTLLETQDRATNNKEFATIFHRRLQHLNGLALTGFFNNGLPEGLTCIESAYSTCVQQAFFGEEVLSEVNQAEFEKKRLNLQIPRHPTALALYALNLKKLNNETLNTEMQRFVWSLLRGSFHKERYSGSSEHMDILRKDFPVLWKQWQTCPESAPLDQGPAPVAVKSCYTEENPAKLTRISPQQQKGPLEVMISDDWEDLLLSGTDVFGSCQRIDDDPDLNKCLLGYCMDGKIQMAAIKEKETGTIVSRAIVKLLLTSNKEGRLVPALFLEKIYPHPCSPEHEAALKQIVRERAQTLRVPLYTEMEAGAATEPVTLCSLGSPSPFEYEDGGGLGVADRGKYEIKGKALQTQK